MEEGPPKKEKQQQQQQQQQQQSPYQQRNGEREVAAAFFTAMMAASTNYNTHRQNALMRAAAGLAHGPPLYCGPAAPAPPAPAPAPPAPPAEKVNLPKPYHPVPQNTKKWSNSDQTPAFLEYTEATSLAARAKELALAQKRQVPHPSSQPILKKQKVGPTETARDQSPNPSNPPTSTSSTPSQQEPAGSANVPAALEASGVKCPLIGPFLESFEQGTFLENWENQVTRVVGGFHLYGNRMECRTPMPRAGFPGQPPPPPLIIGYTESQLQEMAETMVQQQNRSLADAIRMTYHECKSRHAAVLEDEVARRVKAAMAMAHKKLEQEYMPNPEAKSTATLSKLLEEKLQNTTEETNQLKKDLQISETREADLVTTLGQIRLEKARIQRERDNLKLEMEEMKRNHARSLQAMMKASVASLRTLRRPPRGDDSHYE